MDIPFERWDFPLDGETETVFHFAKIYYSKLDCKVTWYTIQSWTVRWQWLLFQTSKCQIQFYSLFNKTNCPLHSRDHSSIVALCVFILLHICELKVNQKLWCTHSWIKLFCEYCKLVMKFAEQVSSVGSIVITAYQGLGHEWELLFEKTFSPNFKVIMESGRR